MGDGPARPGRARRAARREDARRRLPHGGALLDAGRGDPPAAAPRDPPRGRLRWTPPLRGRDRPGHRGDARRHLHRPVAARLQAHRRGSRPERRRRERRVGGADRRPGPRDRRGRGRRPRSAASTCSWPGWRPPPRRGSRSRWSGPPGGGARPPARARGGGAGGGGDRGRGRRGARRLLQRRGGAARAASRATEAVGRRWEALFDRKPAWWCELWRRLRAERALRSGAPGPPRARRRIPVSASLVYFELDGEEHCIATVATSGSSSARRRPSGWRASARSPPAWPTRSTTRWPTCSGTSRSCARAWSRRRSARWATRSGARWPRPSTARSGCATWSARCGPTRAPGHGPPARVDVAEELGGALRLVGNTIRAPRRVVEQLGAVPPVLARPNELGQVFVNLLVNAGQAVGPERRAAPRSWSRCFTTPDGGAGVEVADNGRGHPAGDPGADLRALLHDQAGRGRDRAGALDLPRHRDAARRDASASRASRASGRASRCSSPPRGRRGRPGRRRRSRRRAAGSWSWTTIRR